PAGSVRSIDQECGPTTEQRADQPAQRNQNTPHKGGHLTNIPNHPWTMEQSQQSAQSPMPGTTSQPQPGKQGNKTHPHQPRGHQHETRDPKWQAPGQHRHMYAPQTNKPRPPGPARQSSRPPCPRERHQPSKQKGGTEKPQHAQQKSRTPPPPITQNHQHLCQPSQHRLPKSIACSHQEPPPR
ncbi:hypothetical protein ILYODFUR_032774, partial [Ilyodon furcidens]